MCQLNCGGGVWFLRQKCVRQRWHRNKPTKCFSFFLFFRFSIHPRDVISWMIDKCQKTSSIIWNAQSNRFIANQLNKLFIHHIWIPFVLVQLWDNAYRASNIILPRSDKQTSQLPHLIFKGAKREKKTLDDQTKQNDCFSHGLHGSSAERFVSFQQICAVAHVKRSTLITCYQSDTSIVLLLKK